MTLKFECQYCGHEWIETLYSKDAVDNKKCVKCKDTNLKVKNVDHKVNYYQGSPAFPIKSMSEEEEKELLDEFEKLYRFM